MAAQRLGRPLDPGDRHYLFEAGPALLFVAGFDGRLRDLSAAWQRCTGWSRQELVGRVLSRLLHPDDSARAEEALRAAERSGASGLVGSRWRCRDGSYRWLLWEVAALPQRAKHYGAAFEVSLDHAASFDSAVEDEHRLLRARFAAARQANGMGLWDLDLATDEFWCSEEVARLLDEGSPAGGRRTFASLLTRIHPDDVAAFLTSLSHTAEEGRPSSMAFRLVRRGGAALALRGHHAVVRGKDGGLRRIVGTVQVDSPSEGKAGAA